MRSDKPNRLFNIYGNNVGYSFAGNVWSTSGISPAILTCSGGRREPMIMLSCDIKTKSMKHNRDFHRQVRVVYRACRRLYGIEKTQDECLKIFKIVFPELHRLRNSDEETADVPQSVTDGLLSVAHDWNPHGVLSGIVSHVIGQLQMSLSWKRENLIEFYEDIMPVAMRIRKLTPRETGRLMGLNDEEIDIMFASGLSNSAMYKLHGNSIVIDVMVALFDTLLVNTEQKKEVGMQLSLF